MDKSPVGYLDGKDATHEQIIAYLLKIEQGLTEEEIREMLSHESKEAIELISQLMKVNAKERIGSNYEVEKVIEHKWFDKETVELAK